MAYIRSPWLGFIVSGCMALALTVYELLPGVQNQYSSSLCIGGFGILGGVALMVGLAWGYYVGWDLQGDFPDEPSNDITPEEEGKDY